MTNIKTMTLEELEANLSLLLQSPKDLGPLELIVRRPGLDEREVLPEGNLDLRLGLVGDTWISRKGPGTPDGSANSKAQVTLMNSRVIALLAQTRERWPLAGDQLYGDLDLSTTNLPPATRLRVGSAILEITDQPHTGCEKFAARFGQDAYLFVNAPAYQKYRLRGVNARVIQTGLIKVGDNIEVIRKSGERLAEKVDWSKHAP
jgi:MOSC domain-containing protein YiiM